MNFVILSLATNDNHGNDTGRVSALHLDGAIELNWGELGGSEPRYSIKNGILKLSRRSFAIDGKTDWYGNMAWTGVRMSALQAARLLNYLSTDGRWHLEGCLCDLTDLYAKGSITEQSLVEALS